MLVSHADPVGRRIEAPLGGSTAAQSFWSREGCDKEGSLEELGKFEEELVLPV